jgi:hypothetical protein
VLLQVLLQNGRDGCGERHGPVAGAGLGLADHPPATDASYRSLDAQSAAGQDIGPAQGGGLTEPEATEGQDQDV